MKYAHLEKDTNKVLGWYSDDIHTVIPTPNIEVSDETWQEALNINANCYENEAFIVKDFRTPDEISSQEINQKISEAKQYLSDTDFKMLPDYTTRPDGEPIEDIKAKRAAARELIRQLEQ